MDSSLEQDRGEENMTRRFRPLQESVDIVLKMLRVAMYYGDQSEIQYWIERLHGYQKLAFLKGVTLRPLEIEEKT
jgi:hypothetical protein